MDSREHFFRNGHPLDALEEREKRWGHRILQPEGLRLNGLSGEVFAARLKGVGCSLEIRSILEPDVNRDVGMIFHLD